jgi:peptidoglycan/xylan/chitin deacetylase (PgdA/CDA1 family)
MRVYVTFDVEVWCDGWSDLDARFPKAFERYYFGRSEAGGYALPKTLEILERHGLTGVFFVEPLFSARFGSSYLDRVTRLIAGASQDIQLHLHPEWTDEIRPPPIENVSGKRQHLVHYTEDEQTQLIGAARRLLETSKGSAVDTFRAGSFAANRATYRALARNGIALDSSLNSDFDYAAGSIQGLADWAGERTIEGVQVFPVSVFRDGFGRMRPAQVNACGAAEIRRALLDARARGCQHFVLVSHNFDMLKAGTSDPDWFVVRRFEELCRFLGENCELFDVGPFRHGAPPSEAESRPQVPMWATARRWVEQVARRVT